MQHAHPVILAGSGDIQHPVLGFRRSDDDFIGPADDFGGGDKSFRETADKVFGHRSVVGCWVHDSRLNWAEIRSSIGIFAPGISWVGSRDGRSRWVGFPGMASAGPSTEKIRHPAAGIVCRKGFASRWCYARNTMNTFYRFLSLWALFGAFSKLPAASPFQAPDENAGVGIDQTDGLIYPFSMTVIGILAGEARVVISVDSSGKLIDVLVVGYTKSAFAEAAVAALKRWRFEPARVRGAAHASRAQVLFTFKNGMGVMVQALPGSMGLSRLSRSDEERYTYRASQLRQLDRIPLPVHVVPPTAFKSDPKNAKRVVAVEFYIDEEGRVRMPAIGRDEADDDYAAAAVSAVEQWRFEPPTRKGLPVLVLAKQEFNFVNKP